MFAGRQAGLLLAALSILVDITAALHYSLDREDLHLDVATTRAPRTPMVNLSRALDCLRQTTPGLKLEYPQDADKHVREIQKAMQPWSRGFVGTYHVEDIWMTHFVKLWENHTKTKGTKLSDVFGPFIPIFTQWVDPWVNYKGRKMMRYPKGFVEALEKVLRKEVPYITVSQNDEGIEGKRELLLERHPNILVLSAGGFGHVAVPLVRTMGQSYGLAKKYFDRTLFLQRKRGLMPERKYFISYVGSLVHAPHDMRKRMQDVVEKFAAEQNISDKVLFYKTDKGDWQDVMFNSRFTLVPRGYGRTSYHLVEAIQRGLIPIHVYTDMPWVPYPQLYDKIGFKTTVEALPELLLKLRNMTDDEVNSLEQRVAWVAWNYFNSDAITSQIQGFMTGSSYLECQRLPASPTDK